MAFSYNIFYIFYNLLKNNISTTITNNNCRRMSNKSLNLELSEEVWEIIDTHFKLKAESDSEYFPKSLRII